MNCKNCGARLADGAKTCPNCGAAAGEDTGYTLLTSNDIVKDYYDDGKKKLGKGAKFVLVLLLVAALAGGGSYLYFSFLEPHIFKAPDIVFDTGAGIINEDEKIVYAFIHSPKEIEYIHGALLYDTLSSSSEPIASDYQYTKNVDATFRAVFFDIDETALHRDGDIYMAEITFSFKGSSKRYTYKEMIKFTAEDESDVSDIIFDHSLNATNLKAPEAEDETAAQEKETQQTSAAAVTDTDFIYNGYWYTPPVAQGETRTIEAYRFNNDNSYTLTHYLSENGGDWSASVTNGHYELEDGYITVSEGESTVYIRIGENTLTLEESGAPAGDLTNRVYNSAVNAEDFFNP